MNIISRLHRKPGRFLGRALSAGLSVWVLGVAFSPALATVPVDQAPLIIQKPLPPNIVLMLDDSGSMNNDYMPDDLSDTSLGGYRNSAINGVYYNPTVTYTPPPKADGTLYPNSPSITGAYKDGFRDTSATDITRFKGSFNYYTRFTIASTSTYAAAFGCKSGDTLMTSGSYKGQCRHSDWSGYTYYSPYSCNYGDSGPDGSNICTATTYSYKYFFTYTTGTSNVLHYVGQSGDCASLSSADQAVCDDSSTAQQNVANWFSYYRTRMLMAKSGVMSAFSGVDSNFRVGFGSIGGSNANSSSLGDDYYAFTTSAQGDTYQTGIAVVKPFGDGTSGTQKSKLWNWLADTKPTSWTPLRGALNAVGKYYGTQQPWLTLDGESGYVSGASTELACRQSYSILTTDGFWNGSTPSNIGNVDNAKATLSGSNNQTYTYTPAAPYSDSTSNTLADVAMKYWVTDLRSSTPNEVPTSTEDPAFWQHMTTFTLGMGFAPTGISPAGTTVKQIFDWANGGTAIPNFSWPTPSSDSQNNIADLAHAAVDGHGGFYSATSPEAFASGMKDALKRASERVGTGASLAANSTQLKTGTVAYQANYYTAKWKGDLKALAVYPNTGAIAATPTWTAAGSLPAAASRNIWTYNPTVTGNNSPYVIFQNGTGSTPPALSTAQLSALGGTAAAQANMVNYLRGDSTLEQKNTNGTYRNRDTPLGDIVDSQPVYVGTPDPNLFANQTFTGSSTYLAFASGTTDNQGNFTPSTAASRAGLIYVAANDGMLHGFDATTGAEKFAYIPGAVLTAGSAGGLVGLSQLSSPDYGTTTSAPHQYFNDGELTVADVYMGSAWKTVLVGTTGRGLAKAVYAFDITDPTAIKFLWERSATDGKTNSNYIGQMSGKPVIAQTADSTWSVLMGNGYNSAAGVSALLQFNLATGALSVHATTDTSADNGLAAPGVWMDPAGTGVSTVAYAGDLHGNVWSFTLNTGSGSTTATPSSTGSLLFVAKDSSGNLQPITGGMLVGKDPANGNTWVFFGTGQYLSTTDLSNTATQSWYGLIVQTTNATNSPVIASTMTRADNLVQRAIVAETEGDAKATPPVSPARAVTPTPTSSDMTGKSGWYMDLLSPTGTGGALVAQGERIVTSNQFQGNLLLGTTRIPQAADICNPSGSGWIMAINPFTGTNPSDNFFDVNGDGLVNASDTVTVNGTSYPAAGIGFSSLPNNPIFVGGSMLVSFDNGSNSSITTSGSTGSIQRVSWRELISQ
jgi:type IV pilus assembly protein PilY1